MPGLISTVWGTHIYGLWENMIFLGSCLFIRLQVDRQDSPRMPRERRY